jgi:hypothetical protein
MKFYHDTSIIDHGADTRGLDIDFQTPITVGKFVDLEKPTFLDAYNTRMKLIFGDKFDPYGGNGRG